MKISIILALWLTASGASAATIGSYPNATTPLTGSEKMVASQGLTTVNVMPSMIRGYVNNSSAFVCDGVTDNATALNAALASGLPFALPSGRCYFNANLVAQTANAHGQIMRGQGEPAADGTGAGATILVAGPAVTTALTNDGTPFASYAQGFGVENLGLDLTGAATNAIGFAFKQSFDGHLTDVRVLGAAPSTGKTSLAIYPGAYVFHAERFHGGLVNCLGNGVNNPTTYLLDVPDVQQINVTWCPNFTTHGGAVQNPYSAGLTVLYVAPGVNVGNYPNAGGVYLYLTGLVNNSNSFLTEGTDFESPGGYPATYNDGSHGVLPAIPAFSIQGGSQGCQMTSPQGGNLYIYDPNRYCTLENYQPGGGGGGNFANQIANFNNTVNLDNSSTFNCWAGNRFYGGVQSCLIDASTGAGWLRGLDIKPTVAGSGNFRVFDSTGRAVIQTDQNSGSGNPGTLALNYGSQLVCYTDLETTQSCQLRADTGFFKLNPPAGGTIILTGANGTVTASGGFQGAVGNVTPNTGTFTTLSASSTVSGAGFTAYLASPPAIGSTVAGSGAFTTLVATSINTTPIGTVTPSSGAFTTVTASGVAQFNGPIRQATHTVATLPASPTVGQRDFVTDATACTFATAPTGGGAVGCPVYYDGAWKEG